MKSTKNLWLLIILVLFIGNAAFAHEYWIEVENFSPITGTKTKIFIKGGHSFPESEFAISDEIIFESKVITPAKTAFVYTTTKEKKERIGEIGFEESGVYLLNLVLKKPKAQDPLYYAKTIVHIKDETSEEKISYEAGHRLEVVPQKDITLLKEDDELPLKLVYEGKPIKGNLNISIEGTKNFTLKTDENGIAHMKIKKKGRYLITASHEKIGCSLVFYLDIEKGEK